LLIFWKGQLAACTIDTNWNFQIFIFVLHCIPGSWDSRMIDLQLLLGRFTLPDFDAVVQCHLDYMYPFGVQYYLSCSSWYILPIAIHAVQLDYPITVVKTECRLIQKFHMNFGWCYWQIFCSLVVFLILPILVFLTIVNMILCTYILCHFWQWMVVWPCRAKVGIQHAFADILLSEKNECCRAQSKNSTQGSKWAHVRKSETSKISSGLVKIQDN
jgi:hypothetical protein